MPFRYLPLANCYTCVWTMLKKCPLKVFASRRMFAYFLCVSLNVSICSSSSGSTVLLVLPSFSYRDCLEHLYVDIVHFLIFSSLLFLTSCSLGVAGVVKEMLLDATIIMVSHFTFLRVNINAPEQSLSVLGLCRSSLPGLDQLRLYPMAPASLCCCLKSCSSWSIISSMGLLVRLAMIQC